MRSYRTCLVAALSISCLPQATVRAWSQEDVQAKARQTVARAAASSALEAFLREMGEAPPAAARLEEVMLADVGRHAQRAASRDLLKVWWDKDTRERVVAKAGEILKVANRDQAGELPEAWVKDAVRQYEGQIRNAIQADLLKHLDTIFEKARTGALAKQRALLALETTPTVPEVELLIKGEEAGVRARLKRSMGLAVPQPFEEIAADMDALVEKSLTRARAEYAAQSDSVSGAEPAAVEEGALRLALEEHLKSFAKGRPYGPFPSIISRKVPERAARLVREKLLKAGSGAWSFRMGDCKRIVDSDLKGHVLPDSSFPLTVTHLEPEAWRASIESHAKAVPPERRQGFQAALSTILKEEEIKRAFRKALEGQLRAPWQAAREEIAQRQLTTGFPALASASWVPTEDLIVKSRRGELKDDFPGTVEWPGVCTLAMRGDVLEKSLEETRGHVQKALRERLEKGCEVFALQFGLVEKRAPFYESEILAGRLTDPVKATAVFEGDVATLWAVHPSSPGFKELFQATRQRIVEVVSKYFQQREKREREEILRHETRGAEKKAGSGEKSGPKGGEGGGGGGKGGGKEGSGDGGGEGSNRSACLCGEGCCCPSKPEGTAVPPQRPPAPAPVLEIRVLGMSLKWLFALFMVLMAIAVRSAWLMARRQCDTCAKSMKESVTP